MSAASESKGIDWTALAPWIYSIVMFAIWEGAVHLFKIAPFVLPAPSRILMATYEFWPAIWTNSLQTLWTTLLGFAMAIVGGLLLGILVGWSRTIYAGLYPLMVGFNLVAKVVSGRDRPAGVVFWQSVVGMIFFAPLGLWYWQTPSLPQLGLFLAMGLFGTLGYFFITWAYRLLDISALQPITFLGIVWAALMDVAVWGKTSDVWTFVGAAIIVTATSYIAHREASAGRKRA